MEMWSPYVSNYGNPIRYTDPLGDEASCCLGIDLRFSIPSVVLGNKVRQAVFGGARQTANKAMAALNREVTGGDTRLNPNAPIPIRNGQQGINRVTDKIDMAGPAITVLKTTSDLAALLPVAEAGAPMEIGIMLKAGGDGTLVKNLFTSGMASAAKGELGEQLTKAVLESQYPSAEILEQVYIKLEGGTNMIADFVPEADNRVLGVFESKVDGSRLSAAHSMFYEQLKKGVMFGKNAGVFSGTEVGTGITRNNIYRWDSATGAYKLE